MENTANIFIEAYKKQTFNTRDEAIPFGSIRTEDFLPAAHFAISEARKKISLIKTNSQSPNFENTILALETASELFETVSSVYFNLFSAEASQEHQAIAKEISPLAAAFSSEVSLDSELFEKIKQVYQNSKTLNPEQKMLTEKYYKDFCRNGALLSPSDKEKIRNIDQELSKLSPQFSENVLKSTNSFELVIDNPADLKGIPDGVIESFAAEAESKGHKGKWLVTLHAPSYIPFMQYCQNRSLREKLWRAYNSRSFGGPNDNSQIVLKTVHLRHQRAQLLGFSTHADFVLADRMAETSENVFKFLKRLLEPSKKAALKDIQEVKTFAQKVDGLSELMPWDFSYYSEKLKEEKFKLSEEELRPYFSLEKVVQGVFEHAKKLYNLSFKPLTDVPVYHPDVKAYEVTDTQSGEYVGLFYTDFFPRETKKGGAWMTAYREQGFSSGQVRRPHVSIVCNFTKPTPSKPSLLTYDEVQTLFHEFGHALHGLLSKVTYKSIGGTNVYWDFVELPSQIMENWVREKEGLDLFASHYETGAKIPQDLVEKIKAANQFQSGYFSLRQLNFAYLDMNWHSKDPKQIQDVDNFEQESTANTQVLPRIPGTNTSCAFSHIFAGGYSAGYYSYKWAEVLDADAFEFFKEKGLFNPEVAQKFKDFVLSKGGSEHPMTLYKKFRGREPDPNSLLRRDGLLDQ